MHATSIYSLTLAMAAALTSAAPTQRSPVPVFHVTDYRTLCSEANVQHECTTTFKVAYNDSPSLNCSIKSSDNDYVYCQAPGPEASVAAFIQASETEPGDIKQTLKLRYEFQAAGGEKDDTYGEKELSSPQPTDFDVIADKETKSA